jgi:hypothetical protein
VPALADATIIGSGSAAGACSDVLSRAGFYLRHAFELDPLDRSPVILGDVHGALGIARQAVEDGRHLLICNPQFLTGDRLTQMLAERRSAQALFLWSERCYHPGYRFVGGLIETDATWRPKYLRLETLCAEPTTSTLARWRTLDALRLLMSVADDAPLSVSGTQAENSTRVGPDLITMLVAFKDLEAFVQVGMGEAIERREMLLAAPNRRAYVDELNSSAPVRLVDYDASSRPGAGARWLACGTPTTDEMARQQCLAFFEATNRPSRAQDEAEAWKRSLATLAGLDRSLEANGAAVRVFLREDAPRFRLVGNNGALRLATPPASA